MQPATNCSVRMSRGTTPLPADACLFFCDVSRITAQHDMADGLVPKDKKAGKGDEALETWYVIMRTTHSICSRSGWAAPVNQSHPEQNPQCDDQLRKKCPKRAGKKEMVILIPSSRLYGT
ncbi:hypothetical protein AOLI_G00081920 [Acnodon oligacanthus]